MSPRNALAFLALSLAVVGACTDVSTAVDMACTTPRAELPLLQANGDGTDVNVCVRAGGNMLSASGTACTRDGTGSEICGFELTIAASGGARLLSFSPASGIVSSLSANRVLLNGVNPDPRDLAPIAVGTLRVACSEAPCGVVAEGRFVDAALKFVALGPFALTRESGPPTM